MPGGFPPAPPFAAKPMSTSTASTTIRRTLQSIAHNWPQDKLRPTIQFSAAIEKATDRIFFQSAATTTTTTAAAATGAAQGTPINLTELQLHKAQATADSLQRLLDSDALKTVRPHPLPFSLPPVCLLTRSLLRQYPMSPRTLNPPSFPKHYQRMKDALDKANRGEVVKGPSWSERFFVWR